MLLKNRATLLIFGMLLISMTLLRLACADEEKTAGGSSSNSSSQQVVGRSQWRGRSLSVEGGFRGSGQVAGAVSGREDGILVPGAMSGPEEAPGEAAQPAPGTPPKPPVSRRRAPMTWEQFYDIVEPLCNSLNWFVYP